MCLRQYEDVCSRHVEEATQGVISVHIQAWGVSMSTCGNIIGKRLTRIKSCRYILLAQAIECTLKLAGSVFDKKNKQAFIGNEVLVDICGLQYRPVIQELKS